MKAYAYERNSCLPQCVTIKWDDINWSPHPTHTHTHTHHTNLGICQLEKWTHNLLSARQTPKPLDHRLLWIYHSELIQTGSLQYISRSWWSCGLGICLHAGGCGFNSHDGKFPDIFCWGICYMDVAYCCLSLIVALWVGKLFFSYSNFNYNFS